MRIRKGNEVNEKKNQRESLFPFVVLLHDMSYHAPTNGVAHGYL